MRHVVLDTETTGGSVRNGDRVCEVGMVETINHIPTGRVFHEYINPERDIHWAATRVHGLKLPMLASCPKFIDIGQEARDFIAGDKVLAHNARFDSQFMNSEFRRAGIDEAPSWIDTVRICEKAHPGGRHKLDVMVERLGIATPDRKIHGALLDAAILAAVVAKINNIPSIDIEALIEQGRRLEPHSHARVNRSRRSPTRPAADVAPPVTSQPDNRQKNHREIAAINAQPMSLYGTGYAALRSGRDSWSNMPIKDILSGLKDEVQARDEFQAILGLSDADRNSALRWIARGLEPGHALCMQITLAERYDRPVPDESIKIARTLTSTDEDPEPGF